MSKDRSSMTMVAFDDRARDWVKRVEKGEAARMGCPIVEAREEVASRIGVQPGTLENLRRGRTKGVRGWVYERLRAAVIQEFLFEIMALSHELDALRQSGAHPASDEIAQVEAGLAALREILNGSVK